MKVMDELQAVLFDLDGTVYLGDQPLPGAVSFIRRLRAEGIRTMFISNKPLEPRRVYAEKLSRLGIAAQEDDILTSAYVLGQYLRQHYPDMQYYVVGEEALREELRGYGLKVSGEFEDQDSRSVIEPRGVDAVVIAFDRTLNYRKLNTAYQALKRGARFFATNTDKVCPMPNGALPDAGGTVAYLEHISGRTVELLAGKPSPLIVQVALGRLDASAQQCLMVGDRLETDIRMGRQAGMKTAVVLSGVTTREMALQAEEKPDWIVQNLAELENLLFDS